MPNKELPKVYNPADYEDVIYAEWEKSGFFNPDECVKKGLVKKNAPSYSIVMPPPNVTGTLHIGHAVMLVIEDILTRFNRLRGKKVLWLPGTDHAAIATQTKVEKILKAEGLNRHKLGREKFLQRVNKFAKESHDVIVNQVKKMGCSCDWSREAYTLDQTRSRAVASVFKMMHDDGLIYRGERIVNWCPNCRSTLADDEVEYKNQKAKIYTFRYGKNFPFAIATTRPETKLGDTAVAVNPRDERYKKYIGKIFKVNFAGVDLELKIIADRNVDINFGTGALGVTPAHSQIDWQMAEENNLKIIKVIDEQGDIKSGFNRYSGKKVKEARAMIVENLRQAGLLEKEEEVENNLSLCYRCSAPIEPLPSLQWFIDVNKKIAKHNKSIKELSIDAVKKGVFGREKIKIVPGRFEKNYFHWLDNLRDWCVSRQIWFGHQIPAWYRESKTYVGINEPAGKGWQQDKDTLDTWFSSGLWTFSTLARKPEEVKIKNGRIEITNNDFKIYHPTAVLETGYDILFFWVARMIIMTAYAVGDIPFKDVYLHGLIRDDKGRKMSKSLGNVIDPLDVCKKYGTDAVRLALVIGTTPGNDMNLSEEKIAGYRNFTNKLWNISRYIITNANFKSKNSKLPIKNLTVADKWLLGRLNNLIEEVTKDLENYKFSEAGENLRDFTWNDLADWYLEISKFEKGKDKILHFVLENILQLWHPFMPFVTEKIWHEMEHENLLMVGKWPKPDSIASLQKDRKEFELIKKIIIAIRNARSANRIEPAKKVKAVIYAGGREKFVESQAHLIKNLRTGLSELEIKNKGEKLPKAVCAAVGKIEIYLAGAVDEIKEKARLEKEINNLGKIIKAAEIRLANKEFIDKAPIEIIKKEKEKLKGWQAELKSLKNR